MRRKLAGVIGLLSAPLASAVIAVLTTPAATEIGLANMLGFLVLFYIVALVLELLIGGPLFLICFYLNIIRWWSAVCVGGLIGAVAAVAMRAPNEQKLHDLVV